MSLAPSDPDHGQRLMWTLAMVTATRRRKGVLIMDLATITGEDDLHCGYCGLPVVPAEGPLPGYRHGEGVPQVGPVSPGDYVTRGHRPGLAVGAFDIVTKADLDREGN